MAGYFGIYTAASAWYISFAELFNEIWFRGRVSLQSFPACKTVCEELLACNRFVRTLFGSFSRAQQRCASPAVNPMALLLLLCVACPGSSAAWIAFAGRHSSRGHDLATKVQLQNCQRGAVEEATAKGRTLISCTGSLSSRKEYGCTSCKPIVPFQAASRTAL